MILLFLALLVISIGLMAGPSAAGITLFVILCIWAILFIVYS